MTNIRFRIEDAEPMAGFGPVGTAHLVAADPTTARCSAPVAYRMAPVTPARAGTI